MATTHTFSIIRTIDSPWVYGPSEVYSATPCQCGIASGALHRTLREARLAPMHICRPTRQAPVWDGMVIVERYDASGQLVEQD